VSASGVHEVVIGCDADLLAYDVKEISVPAGASIQITFRNDAPTSQVYHNLLVVMPGTAMDVARRGVEVGYDVGWVPDIPEVLAATRLLKPGEEDTITFVAPLEPGDYPYICTVPGHCPAMSGVLRVRK
jgi:azurin